MENKYFVLKALAESKFCIYAKNIDQTLEPMANICRNPLTDECYIKTHGSALQDRVVTWEMFKEFIMLVDEAYDKLERIY